MEERQGKREMRVGRQEGEEEEFGVGGVGGTLVEQQVGA